MPDQQSLYARTGTPLAERMRPGSFSELIGLNHLWESGSLIERSLRSDTFPSLIFWGPPGSGKTTLARIIAEELDLPFIAFSAVTSGVKEIRSAIETADRFGKIVLFVDEIHRFNKAQQDAFLHAVEEGKIILMGATTENPSFELNAALLSRVKVITLPSLSRDHLDELISRALNEERGLEGKVRLEDKARQALITLSGGDARVALNLLEMCASITHEITEQTVREVAQRPVPVYDKAGDAHFDMISALHKSVRNSDPQAALYWLARMLVGGEDPLYVARRLMRAAVEDIGLADPHALSVAVAAQQAVHFLGMPEGALALAELTVYLSVAPKSNAIYLAYGKAREAAEKTPNEPVPLQIRNAPTRLMKEMGYGKEYIYAHDTPEGVSDMRCLPPVLEGKAFYHPVARGFEKQINILLDRIEEARKSMNEKERDSGDEKE